MAQRVITLAKEETCQEILTRIIALETRVEKKALSIQVGGDYPYVKTIIGTFAEFRNKQNIIINGEAEFALIGHPSQFYYYRETNVWNNGTQLVLNSSSQGGVDLGRCSTMAIGRIVVSNNSDVSGFVFIAKFKSPNGTITLKPIS